MSVRRAHGRAKEYGRLTVSECTPSDELPPARAEPSACRRDAVTGQFLPGNRSGGNARLVKAGPRGALVKLERKGDEAARAALAFGRRYSVHRRGELAKLHGDLSAGVAAMIESAGDLLSASRYWSARSVAEGSADYARLSAQLVAGSRQAERDAWELASREAAARPRMGAHGLAALVARAPKQASARVRDTTAELAPAPPFTPGGGVETGPPHSPTDTPTPLPTSQTAPNADDERRNGSGPLPRCPLIYPGSGRQCVRAEGHAEPHDDGAGQ